MSHIDVGSMSEEELIEQLGDEPAAKSLPFFAMNFGHEVWFIHRRGAQPSRIRINKPANTGGDGQALHMPPSPVQKYRKAVQRYRRLRAAERSWLPAGSGETRHVQGAAEEKEEKEEKEEEEEEGADTKEDRRSDRKASVVNPTMTTRSHANETSKANKMLKALISAPAALLDYGKIIEDINVSLDKRLWNHSLDEQAAYDLPNAIDYVLEHSKRDKLILLGDSSGGALVIMTLILEPSLDKKRKCTN